MSNRWARGRSRRISGSTFNQSCEASLRRLGLERIDLYQIHRADPNTPVEETLTALDRLVQDGKVLYLGASSMFAWELMKMLSVSERNGWARFISMQNHYNLVYREEEREMMPLLWIKGWASFPGRPGRGLLTVSAPGGARRPTRDEHDAPRPRALRPRVGLGRFDATLRVAERPRFEPLQVASLAAVAAGGRGAGVGFTKVGQWTRRPRRSTWCSPKRNAPNSRRPTGPTRCAAGSAARSACRGSARERRHAPRHTGPDPHQGGLRSGLQERRAPCLQDPTAHQPLARAKRAVLDVRLKAELFQRGGSLQGARAAQQDRAADRRGTGRGRDSAPRRANHGQAWRSRRGTTA